MVAKLQQLPPAAVSARKFVGMQKCIAADVPDLIMAQNGYCGTHRGLCKSLDLYQANLPIHSC